MQLKIIKQLNINIMTKEEEKQFFELYAQLVAAQEDLAQLRDLSKEKRAEIRRIEEQMKAIGGAK